MTHARIWWTVLALETVGCSRLPAMEGDTPGECTDGADNDRDGHFDCEDPGCFDSPECDELDSHPADDTGTTPDNHTAEDTGTTVDTEPQDTDGDGVLDDEDCAPDDPAVSPLADEEPYDGIDNDCNADTLDDDFDRDGILAADDCDDGNPAIGIDATTACWDPSEARFRLTGAGSFGASLLVPGDVDGDGIDDVLVGAPTTHRSLGQVALYSGATLSTAAPLATWTGRADYDSIGNTGQLVHTGDLDGDGRADLAVSFPFADPGSFANTGMVAILLTSDTHAWNPSAPLDTAASLTVHGRATGDKLGTATLVTDLDGDGLPDLITTAPQDDGGLTNGGTVFVFTGGLSAPGDLSANDADHRFHGAFQETLGDGQLVVVGDVNGDGTLELAVGSTGSDGEATDAGVVYLLSAPTEQVDGPLADVALVQLHGRAYGDGFGHGIASLQDIDGDGNHDFVVGALQGDGAATDSGSAHLFHGAADWAGTLTLTDASVSWSGHTGLGRTGARPRVLPGAAGSPDLVLATPQADTGGHVSVLSSAADWAGGDPAADAHTWIRSRERDGLGSAVAAWSGGLLVGAPGAEDGDGAVVFIELE